MTTFSYPQKPNRTFKFAVILMCIALCFYTYPVLPGLNIIIIIWMIYYTINVQGVEIDTENNQYRNYRSFLGFKTGKWKPLKSYCAIIILARKEGRGIWGFSMAFSYRQVNKNFDVFLTNSIHRSRLYLETFDDKNKALEFAYKIEEDTQLPVEIYNPQISQATRDRINQRRNRR